MKLFDSVRTRFNGQTREKFGLGHRFPLTKAMARSITEHNVMPRGSDMSAFTFERRRSDYGTAKSDLVIYDGDGTPILNGRESEGPLGFWPYTA